MELEGTSARPQSEPTLPPELMREILEISALQSYRHAPTLCLVSRDANAWITPFLYRVLRVDGETCRPPIFRKTTPHPHFRHLRNWDATLDAPKLQKIGPHVRSLLIQNQHTSITLDILRYCPNVRNLALWMPRGSTARIAGVLDGLESLQRLSMDPAVVLGSEGPGHTYLYPQPPHFPGLGSRFFHRLTHLELINTTFSEPPYAMWDVADEFCVAKVPNLTHLSVEGIANANVLEKLLVGCPKLELVLPRNVVQDLPDRLVSSRVVWGPRDLTDVIADWERVALVDGDLWELERLRKVRKPGRQS